MQIPKDNIRNNILKAAENIFLEKGYSKTSMREIAAKSNVVLSNIYNYFKNKDEIFCQIVRPVTYAFDKMLHEHHGHSSADILELYSDSYLLYVIQEYIYIIHQHRNLLKILFFCSLGSSLENYKEDFTNRSTLLVKDYLQNMKAKHPQLNIDISDFSIHLHTVWMFTLIEEIIMHKISPGDTEQIIKEYIQFEVIGWRELMKI